jgi:hypothetical protein
MSLEWRGGIPVAQRVTGIDTTGRRIILERDQSQRVTSKWLRIANVGTGSVRIFWTEADFVAGVDYTTIASGVILREPIEATDIWVKADTGTQDIEILSLHRRG